MLDRFYKISEYVENMSVFLFGARKTGKSTFLRKTFPKALYIDLLDSELGALYKRRPSYLYEQLEDKSSDTIVIIDEIQEVPELLNEVHRLIFKNDIRFILCGSSARKLRRKGYNTLGGRAFPCYFYPLVRCEIPDFDLQKALNDGLLPQHYLSKNPKRLLAAYIDVYLKEEIKAEAIVRNLDGFQRFLEVAALTNGEIVNFTNIASDCGVKSVTVKEYFSILQDTLIGYMIPAYTKSMKRKLVQAPRFYYFDVGVANYLLKRQTLIRGSAEYGHAFEHLVIQELIAYIGYTNSQEKLSYWHTYSGLEVDAIIGDARIAIEIKSVDEALPKHLKGLNAFHEEHPDCQLMFVSHDRINRTSSGVKIININDFLKELWEGKIF